MNALFPTPTIAVDKGVPLPAGRERFVRKYPFPDMAIGDSFFVAGVSREKLAGSIRYASCECRRFTTRRVIESGIPGIRVWRIA